MFPLCTPCTFHETGSSFGRFQEVTRETLVMKIGNIISTNSKQTGTTELIQK